MEDCRETVFAPEGLPADSGAGSPTPRECLESLESGCRTVAGSHTGVRSKGGVFKKGLHGAVLRWEWAFIVYRGFRFGCRSVIVFWIIKGPNF